MNDQPELSEMPAALLKVLKRRLGNTQWTEGEMQDHAIALSAAARRTAEEIEGAGRNWLRLENHAVSNVVRNVMAERERQDVKWGVQEHPMVHPSFVGRHAQMAARSYEIPGERRAKDLCQKAAESADLDWTRIIVEEVSEFVAAAVTGDMTKVRDELVQVAACAIAAVECLDRRQAEASARRRAEMLWSNRDENEGYLQQHGLASSGDEDGSTKARPKYHDSPTGGPHPHDVPGSEPWPEHVEQEPPATLDTGLREEDLVTGDDPRFYDEMMGDESPGPFVVDERGDAAPNPQYPFKDMRGPVA